MHHSQKKLPIHHSPLVQSCIRAAGEYSGVRVVASTPKGNGCFTVRFVGPQDRKVEATVTDTTVGKIGNLLAKHFG